MVGIVWQYPAYVQALMPQEIVLTSTHVFLRKTVKLIYSYTYKKILVLNNTKTKNYSCQNNYIPAKTVIWFL